MIRITCMSTLHKVCALLNIYPCYIKCLLQQLYNDTMYNNFYNNVAVQHVVLVVCSSNSFNIT